MSKKLSHKELRLLRDKKNNGLIAIAASIFFIIIMAVFPLFLSHLKYINMTYHKAYFLWAATGIGAVSMLLLILALKKSLSIENYYAENEPARLFTVAEWVLLAFIVWTFISAAISSWLNNFGDVVWRGYEDRSEGFISYLCYAINFIIIARFYKPQRLHLLLVAGSAVLVSLYGVMQFLGLDIFNLLPYDHPSFVDEAGTRLYGPISAYFRTTLGNVNIVSAYCSFMIILFTALFALSRSKWQYLYLGAGIMSFALSLVTGNSGDAHKVAVFGAMVLLIPYWLADRERLGRILIIISGWCIVYAGQSAYLSALKRNSEAGEYFAPFDKSFLDAYTHKNITLFIILAGTLLAVGLCLILLLKAWNVRIMKTAGIIFLLVLIIGGVIGVEIIGARFSDNPSNIIWQAREMMHGRLEDDFGSARGWIWKRAVSVIPDNPVLGTGPDTFYYALGEKLQLEAIERYNVKFDKAHNIFLQITVCMGIPALIAFLVFIGSIFVPAVKNAFERQLLLAFGAAALSYTIQSFFCVEVPITTPLFWIALGVMAGEVWMSKIGYEEIRL